MPLNASAVNPVYGANLFDDSSGITSTITFFIQPDYDKLDIQNGTYSGSSSGTSGGITGTYSGSGSSTQSGKANYSDRSFTARISGTASVYGTMYTSTYSGTITEGGAVTGQGAYGELSDIALNNTESGSISIGSGSVTASESGTVNMTTTHGGSTIVHFHVPYFFGNNLPDDVELVADRYYEFRIQPSNFTSLNGTGHVANISVIDSDGTVIVSKNTPSSNVRNRFFVTGDELRTFASQNDRGNIWGKFYYLDFDFLLESITSPQIITFNPSYTCEVRNVRDEYQYSVGSNQTSDVGTHKEIEKSNAKLDSLNVTESDTNTTTHSIFDSISAFFSSFFSNLIGVFVPEDGFFTTWFNNLNTLLEAKLGILYYPFSVIIQFFTRCTSAFSSQSTGTDIVFPAIEFTNSATGETYTFLSAQHINLADFNITTSSSANSSLVGSSGFGSLVDIIRTFNAFVILFCLLSLLRTKLNLVLRGDNNDN